MKTLPAIPNINANARVNTDFKINNPIMWVAIATIGGIVIWKMYKKYAEGAEQRNLQKALDKSTQVDTAKLTISQADATIIAQQLFVAMDGMGTDQTTVMRLLIDIPRTNDDLKLIGKSFGLKEYGTFGSPWWGSGTPCDLPTWLVKEMSSGNMQKLRNRFAQAGIVC
jgi:hypothetical protein